MEKKLNECITYRYDPETYTVHFESDGAVYHLFTVPESELFCITHSEVMDGKDYSQRDLLFIAGIMQECVLTRPVPRRDLGKIRFKIVAYQKPEDPEKWLDYCLADMEKAVNFYRLLD